MEQVASSISTPLRHTYGTRLVATGVDIKTVQALMRHSSPEKQYVFYSRRLKIARQCQRLSYIAFCPRKVKPKSLR